MLMARPLPTHLCHALPTGVVLHDVHEHGWCIFKEGECQDEDDQRGLETCPWCNKKLIGVAPTMQMPGYVKQKSE